MKARNFGKEKAKERRRIRRRGTELPLMAGRVARLNRGSGPRDKNVNPLDIDDE